MTYKTYSKRRQQLPNRRIRHVHEAGSATVLAVGFVLLLGIGLLYVGQANRITTAELSAQQLEKKIDQLKAENVELEIRLGEYRSLSTVERSSKILNLVAKAKPEFLQAPTDTVAFGE